MGLSSREARTRWSSVVWPPYLATASYIGIHHLPANALLSFSRSMLRLTPPQHYPEPPFTLFFIFKVELLEDVQFLVRHARVIMPSNPEEITGVGVASSMRALQKEMADARQRYALFFFV